AQAPSIAVVVDGVQVGRLLVEPVPALDANLDRDFARAQARRALLAAAGVLLIALSLAFALARRMVRPIRLIAGAARALADGDYGQRLELRRGDEFGALAENVNHLAATLEQHRDTRRRWGADIAHELRTPLSVLHGEIQALQDGIREVTPAALASLRGECDRIAGLVEDLYQLNLADAGALEYRFAQFDLAMLLEQVIAAHSANCDKAGLGLKLVPLPTPHLLVRGDAQRLAQVFNNLLVNACRYTDAPGRIEVSARRESDYWCIDVEDSAPGVPEQSLARLFERLYRVDRSRSRAAGGGGLGLSLCQAIIDAHDGTIEALHSPLGGLRVRVHLPIAGAAL
ncbi:MAG: ATP-binding protein, partial [Rudaea sp.]